MTKEECQKKLLHLMHEALDVYKAFNPDGYNLTMYTFGGDISITSWKSENEMDIDMYEFEDGSIRIDDQYYKPEEII